MESPRNRAGTQEAAESRALPRRHADQGLGLQGRPHHHHSRSGKTSRALPRPLQTACQLSRKGRSTIHARTMPNQNQRKIKVSGLSGVQDPGLFWTNGPDLWTVGCQSWMNQYCILHRTYMAIRRGAFPWEPSDPRTPYGGPVSDGPRRRVLGADSRTARPVRQSRACTGLAHRVPRAVRVRGERAGRVLGVSPKTTSGPKGDHPAKSQQPQDH